MNDLKDRVIAEIDNSRELLVDLSCRIHANPELAYNEFQASSWLCQLLKEKGFIVDKEVGGLPTAFVATSSGMSDEPTIAFLAEYDALPEVGHGCGHNLIGVGAVAAAIGLTVVMPLLPGRIKVIGTPAEEFTEGKAGKIKLLESGIFSDVNVCLMFHPWTETAVALSDLGFIILDVVFLGTPAHAAADPWNAQNALDGVVLTYNNLSVLRQQIQPDARIHALITYGGDAVNVIPERASLRIMFRSPDNNYLKELYRKVENCINAAALASNTKVDFHRLTHVQNSLFNVALYKIAQSNMFALGKDLPVMQFWSGSSDFGNVSQVVPSLTMLIKTHEPGINWHSKTVAEGAVLEMGHNAMLIAAKAMAGCAVDLLAKPDLLKDVKKRFKESMSEGVHAY